MPLKEIKTNARQFVSGDESSLYTVISVNAWSYTVIKHCTETGYAFVVHACLKITDVEKLYNIKL